MIVHLVLSAALALLGAGGLVDTVGTVATRLGASVSAALEASGSAAEALRPVGAQTTAAGDVEVTQVDVVVPPVDASGEIVSTPELRAADAAPQALAADALVGDGRVASEVLETDGFQTVGVTWPAGVAVDGLKPEVRTRALDGTWSGWNTLEVDDSAPDAGSADARSAGVRGGTDPLWVGEADAVQVSFVTGAEAGPADLSLTLVDAPVPVAARAGASGASSTGAMVVQSAAYLTGSASATGAPTIITRAEWGARPQACAFDVASGLVGAVVHHTAGSNSYTTVVQAEQQIRGDQAYHIDGRGWCDIGYNFIVDKWGNIYEGRADSLTKPIIGVHAGGFNTGTLGVSMLGSYDAAPPAATQTSVAQIIGYRLGWYGVDPSGTMSYRTLGGQNSSVPANTTVTLPRVMGHRDVAYTACPGNGGYAALPNIRAMASSFSYDRRLTFAKALVKALYQDMFGRQPDADGLAFWTSQTLDRGVGPVSTDLARSQEYVKTRVAEAYREILRRDAEPGGLASWTAEITSGHLRQEDLRGQLIASDEYYANAGGTPDSYVMALYGDILGRVAASPEVAYWSTAVTKGGRGVAPAGIWYSVESGQRRVNEVYAVYLGRTADPAGLVSWPPYWIAYGENVLRSGIVSSPEYLNRALRLYP